METNVLNQKLSEKNWTNDEKMFPCLLRTLLLHELKPKIKTSLANGEIYCVENNSGFSLLENLWLIKYLP